jgi:hypothetical protein
MFDRWHRGAYARAQLAAVGGEFIKTFDDCVRLHGLKRGPIRQKAVPTKASEFRFSPRSPGKRVGQARISTGWDYSFYL